MSLRNYTSSVPVERSVSLIERELVRGKAMHIAKSYDTQGNLEGIMFQILHNEIPLTFRLPAKWKQAEKMMLSEIRRPRRGTEIKVKEQAQRTAWKLLYDWVSVQVSMIALDQAEAVEVFLPYLFFGTSNQTLFERMKDNGFRQLTEGKH